LGSGITPSGTTPSTFDMNSVIPVVNDTSLPVTHHPMSDFVSYQHLSSPCRSFVSKLPSVFVPRNLQEALNDPKWRTAMHEEIKALHKNKTWDLVKLPNGKKVVGYKWVFIIGHKADGSVEWYKARLVAKGFTQTYEIDYKETFVPVAKMNSITVLLSIAANLNWLLHQFDVKNCISSWRPRRRSLHENSPWIGRFVLSRKSVQTKEGFVISKSMVWTVFPGYVEIWLQVESGWSYTFHQAFLSRKGNSFNCLCWW
jgi:hypothetical protein